jgi:hypothetical protein
MWNFNLKGMKDAATGPTATGQSRLTEVPEPD